MNTSPRPEWSRTTKYLVAIGLAIFAILILYISRTIFRLFIIGALIAFLINPIINFLTKKVHIPVRLAILLSYLVAAIILLLAPLVLIPSILKVVNFFVALDYPIFFNNILQTTIQTLQNIKSLNLQPLGVSLNLAGLVDPLLAALKNTSPAIALQLPPLSVILNSLISAFSVSYGVAVGVVGSVFSGVLAFFFILLTGVYLTIDGDKLYQLVTRNVPADYHPEIDILIQRTQGIWISFFRGEVTLMIIVGTMVWLGASLLGLPGAFALGIISGVLEILPNIGPFLATIPGVLVALTQGSNYLPLNNLVFALIVLVFYILVQQVENYYILPRVMSRALYIHPLVIIGGILVGITVWGILGAVLATPVIATGFLFFGYLYRRMRGIEPFPPEVEGSRGAQTPGYIRSIRERTTRRRTKRAAAKMDKPSNIGDRKP